jgi:hypothetical protein
MSRAEKTFEKFEKRFKNLKSLPRGKFNYVHPLRNSLKTTNSRKKVRRGY